MILLVLYLNRSDPWDRLPAKGSPGEEVTEPVEDWSFMETSARVTLEYGPPIPIRSISGPSFTKESFI